MYGASWDADVLRDQVRSYAVGALADARAALVLDNTQAIRKARNRSASLLRLRPDRRHP